MFLPSVVVQADNIVAIWQGRSDAIPARMTPMLIVVALVIPELVVQVSSGPEEGLIQEFTPDAPN